MRRVLLTVAAVLLGATAVAGPAYAGRIAGDVTVRIEPKAATVTLGQNLDLHITVTNDGASPTPPLVVHLDVTDPSRSTSVDPEDWTSTLSKTIGVLAPGASRTVVWNIQPISKGTFATYAVVLSPGVDNVATSNLGEVRVKEERTLNPGGILGAAVGTPAVVGALLLLQLRLARRRGANSTRG